MFVEDHYNGAGFVIEFVIFIWLTGFKASITIKSAQGAIRSIYFIPTKYLTVLKAIISR